MGRRFERDEPRPPLGHARTQEALSDYEVRHNAWLATRTWDEKAKAAIAEILVYRHPTAEDFRRAAERMEAP